VAALPPAGPETADPVAHGHRHPNRALRRVLHLHGVVEKDHHAITGEPLQRPLVLEDELSHRLVVFAQDAHHLLRLGSLREAGEAAQVEKHDGDLPAMGPERVLGASRHDQFGQLRGEESLEPTEALDVSNLLLDALLERAVPRRQLHEVPGLLVSEMLLLQTRSDPSPQEHGVARLRQVVLGAELDGANDASRLVQGGDHEDGDVSAVGILLEAFQHRGTVQVRHHDVEQNKVDRFATEQRERFEAALGRPDLVALPDEPAGQELAVFLVVVDHQDRRRCDGTVLGGAPVARRWRRRRDGGRGRWDAYRGAHHPAIDERPQPRGRRHDPLSVCNHGSCVAVADQPHEPVRRVPEAVQRRGQHRGEAIEIRRPGLPAGRRERFLDGGQKRPPLGVDGAKLARERT
jgi:hypothetical protein